MTNHPPSHGRTVAYWVATAVLGTEMLVGGVCGILGVAFTRDMLQHLGYPDYFGALLGIGYLLGGLAVLAPGLPRLKEWAYAGATFAYTGAVVSHVAAHDPAGKTFAPIVLLGVVFASWALRPSSRRLAR